MDLVRATRPGVRLFFLGVKHPNPDVPQMRVAVAARDLSDSLGLTGTHVFFNEDWVPYEERADFLMESDIRVSTHLPHVETAFSFRTRILDYLWGRAADRLHRRGRLRRPGDEREARRDGAPGRTSTRWRRRCSVLTDPVFARLAGAVCCVGAGVHLEPGAGTAAGSRAHPAAGAGPGGPVGGGVGQPSGPGCGR